VRTLITGITGQDGSYLAEQLVDAGHDVFGLVHGQDVARRRRISLLVPSATLVEGDLLDSGSLYRAVDQARPDVVYNLAALSAPSASWSQPILAGEVTGLGFLRLMEAVGAVAPEARVVQAGSIALHGPYGAAKSFASAIAADYRSQGMCVSVAVMGGHHSPRRGREFFTRTVTAAVARIFTDPLSGGMSLGWLGRFQDWGWAPDFTKAMQLVADAEPGEYTLSTGDPHSSQDWVAEAFSVVGLDWRDWVTLDTSRSQPTDVPMLTAEPDKRIDWQPRTDFSGLARWMVESELGAS
jgi:GDPmannose 4,6-dehydratase